MTWKALPNISQKERDLAGKGKTVLQTIRPLPIMSDICLNAVISKGEKRKKTLDTWADLQGLLKPAFPTYHITHCH